MYRRSIFTLGPGGLPVANPAAAIGQQIAGRNESARQFDESLSFREREIARQNAQREQAAQAAAAQTEAAENRALQRHLAEKSWAESARAEQRELNKLTLLAKLQDSQPSEPELTFEVSPEEAKIAGVAPGRYNTKNFNAIQKVVQTRMGGNVAAEKESVDSEARAIESLQPFFKKLQEDNTFTEDDRMQVEQKLGLLRKMHPNADAILKQMMLDQLQAVRKSKIDPRLEGYSERDPLPGPGKFPYLGFEYRATPEWPGFGHYFGWGGRDDDRLKVLTKDEYEDKLEKKYLDPYNPLRDIILGKKQEEEDIVDSINKMVREGSK